MKYYTEIESKFYLPVKDERDINHELDNSKLPKWFYEKYQDLINLIPKIKEMFTKFSFDKYFSNQNYSQYDKNHFKSLVQIYKIKYLSISSNLTEELTLSEVRNSIQCYGNILELMFMIDNALFDRDYFIYMMQLFNNALIDIGGIDGSLNKKYLSDKWLLTSKGYLYNTHSTAHEAGNYKNYYLEKTNWFLTTTESCIRKDNSDTGKIKINSELNNSSIIIKNGYIHEAPFDDFLHFTDYYHFNYRIYDPKTIMILIGMIELRQDLFNFFKKLELYTIYPKDNLRKTIEITNNNHIDFLIRCCGVSKITSSPHKTIVTSRLTAKDDFREYLDNGYNICFIPPIIINREKEMVEELNMDSPIVSEYVKNEIVYENEFDGGKVYTNHIRF